MNKSVSLKNLEKYFKYILNRINTLYGSEYIDLINKRLHSLNDLEYIELEDNVFANFKTEYIDNNFIKIIQINNKFFSSDLKNIESLSFESLIHELLHLASFKESGGVGFKDSYVKCFALNEGMTQMIADDLCGYSESKYLRSYNELKLISKIIRTTFGNDVILESYLVDSYILRNKISSLTNDKTYYIKLNEELNNLLYLEHTEDNDEIYIKKLSIILDDIIINIIIPYLKKLDDNEKEKYIYNLLKELKGDNKIKSIFKNKLSKYYNVDDIKYDEIKQNIESKKINFKNQVNEYVKLVKYDEDILSSYYVQRDGKIFSLDKKVEITIPSICNSIYIKLYENENKDDNIINNLINEFLSNKKNIKIKGSDILERRKLFCKLVSVLKSMGYILANDYSELNESDIIKEPILVDYKNLTLNDMRKIHDNFIVSKNYKDGINNVFYKNGIAVVDGDLKKLILFVQNWYMSLGKVKVKNGKVTEVLVDAFSEENKDIFEDIKTSLLYVFENTADLNINEIKNNCRLMESKKIIDKLLLTPENYERIYDYLLTISLPSVYATRRSKSYIENFDTYNDTIMKEAKEIAIKK